MYPDEKADQDQLSKSALFIIRHAMLKHQLLDNNVSNNNTELRVRLFAFKQGELFFNSVKEH